MCGGNDPEPQRETTGERRQAKVMAEKWNYYVNNLAKYQDIFVDNVQMEPTDYEQAKGRAATDTEAAYSGSALVPSTGHKNANVATTLADSALGKGITKSSNMFRSGLQTADRHAAGVQAIMAAGSGERADQAVTESMHSSLNYQQAQHDANMSMNNWQHSQQLKGEALGALATAGYYGYKAAQAPKVTQYSSLNAAEQQPFLDYNQATA